MVDPVSFGPLRPIGQRGLAAPKGEVADGGIAASAVQASPVSLSKLTAAARALAQAGPPVDYARIAQIRQAIATGGYRPDAEAIANAVLRHYNGGNA